MVDFYEMVKAMLREYWLGSIDRVAWAGAEKSLRGQFGRLLE